MIKNKAQKRNPFGSEDSLKRFCNENDISYFGVFGSYARGEDREDSDIDILYELDSNSELKTLFDIGRIQTDLEKLLEKKVDFVDRNYIKEQLKPYITQDLVTLYEER
jgi:uncharacterized protein